MKLTKACARFLRKHGGTILAVAASVGVVATAIETGRATTKAKHLATQMLVNGAWRMIFHLGSPTGGFMVH